MPVVAPLQMLPVKITGHQRLQDRRAVAQIVHCLEQRRDVQGYVATARMQFAPLRQQQNREDVVCVLRHTDDERAHRLLAVLAAAKGDRLKYAERLAGHDALMVRR